MSGEHGSEQQWWRPVVTGLGALVAGSLVVGLVVGLVALGATQVLGGGGGDGTSSAEPERLVLPETERSDDDRRALHANPEPFVPVEDREAEEDAAQAEEDEERREAEEEDEREGRERNRRPISISASPTVVSPMERIDLTGVYQGAEGAQVEVQRREGSSWQDFGGVTATVSGGTFSTYIQTGRAGRNRFRVYDPAADAASAPVIVTVG